MSTLSYVAIGKKPEPPRDGLDINALFSLAEKQSVNHMLDCAAGLSGVHIFDEKLCSARKTYIQNVLVGAYYRKINVLKMLRYLENNLISPIVLKGFSLEDVYFMPDARISGDTDIYVGTEAEDKTLQLLFKAGFDVKKRNKFQKESVCQNKSCGYVEVHAAMYDELTTSVWFNGTVEKDLICEPFLEKSADGFSYKTLSPTDNMIYITLHMIRHFISSGMSLRQMLDVTLFYMHKHEEIDTKRYWKQLAEFGYDNAVNTIMSATVRYCRLDSEWFKLLPAEADQEAEIMVLDDLEKGGYLGYSDFYRRLDAKLLYNKNKSSANGNKKSSNFLLIRRFLTFYIPALFPTREELEEKYNCVKKYPVLIPAVWLHRLVVGGIRSIRDGKVKVGVAVNKNKASNESKSRMQLFEKLKML